MARAVSRTEESLVDGVIDVVLLGRRLDNGRSAVMDALFLVVADRNVDVSLVVVIMLLLDTVDVQPFARPSQESSAICCTRDARMMPKYSIHRGRLSKCDGLKDRRRSMVVACTRTGTYYDTTETDTIFRFLQAYFVG
jgi:hypothetical protein